MYTYLKFAGCIRSFSHSLMILITAGLLAGLDSELLATELIDIPSKRG